MTKAKTVGSFNRVREERELADEIHYQAGVDAYRRNLMHLHVGLPRAKVIDWYYSEYPEMQRYVERHIAAGTCAATVTELRSEVAKMEKMDSPPPPPEQQRNSDFEWMDEFRMKLKVILSRPKVAAIEWSHKERWCGPEPVVFNRVERAMRAYDPAELGAMKQEVMAATFKASCDTVWRARHGQAHSTIVTHSGV